MLYQPSFMAIAVFLFFTLGVVGLSFYLGRKAKSAARNRRPTRYDMERYSAGITGITAAEEIFPFAGGEPIFF